MKKLFNIKSAIVALACTFVFALAATTVVTDAAIITEKPDPNVYTVGVGSTTYVSGANIKINKKSPKKLKKKIKIVNTTTNPKGTSYDIGGAHFNTSAAYADNNAYNAVMEYRYKYKATAGYDLQFKKPGTYTITYESYAEEDIDSEYIDEVYDENYGWRDIRIFYKYDSQKGRLYFKGNNFVSIPSEQADRFTEDRTAGGETYYKSASGVIFPHDDEVAYDYVRATLAVGADKIQHVRYNPENVVKEIITTKYRVVKKNSAPIASITLGKAKSTTSNSFAASGKSSYKATSQRFLSGTNGKLTVKTNKGYNIQSIIVKTYDAQGNAVFQQAKNKGKVNFGDFKSGYTNADGTYSHSLYKTTTVYVNYKNKASGEYTKSIVENLRNPDGTPYQRLKIYTGNYIKSWKKDHPGQQFICYEDATCADHTPHYHSTSDADYGCTNTYTFFKK